MSWRRIAYVVGLVELIAGVALSVHVAQAVADPGRMISALVGQALGGVDVGQILSPLPAALLRLF